MAPRRRGACLDCRPTTATSPICCSLHPSHGSLGSGARVACPDELANLVWAIEEVVESPTGTPRRRDEEPQPPGRRHRRRHPPLRGRHRNGPALAPDGCGRRRVRCGDTRAAGDPPGNGHDARRRAAAPAEEELRRGLHVERTVPAGPLGDRVAAPSSGRRRRTGGSGPVSSGLRFDDVRRPPAEPS